MTSNRCESHQNEEYEGCGLCYAERVDGLIIALDAKREELRAVIRLGVRLEKEAGTLTAERESVFDAPTPPPGGRRLGGINVGLHWTLTLRCGDCSATIRYEDERPEWLWEEEERPPELVAEAERFIEDHPLLLWKHGCFGGPVVSPDGEEVTVPPYVSCGSARLPSHEFWSPFLMPGGEGTRYVVCPACGDHVYPDVDPT